MKCGAGYLTGCIADSWHNPSKEHYLTQLELLVDRGFITRERQAEALHFADSSLNWGPHAGERSICEETSWRRLEFLYGSLYKPKWRRHQLEQLGGRFEQVLRWLEQVVEPISPASPRSRISKVAWSLFRKNLAHSYSPTCEPDLTLYFEALEHLKHEVELPAQLVRMLEYSGLGIFQDTYSEDYCRLGSVVTLTPRGQESLLFKWHTENEECTWPLEHIEEWARMRATTQTAAS